MIIWLYTIIILYHCYVVTFCIGYLYFAYGKNKQTNNKQRYWRHQQGEIRYHCLDLWLNIEKDQMWAEGTPRDCNSVEIVKLCGSNIHKSTILPLKWFPSRVFLKYVWEQLQMTTSARKIYWEAFLSKTTSLNWNLILKSLKLFLVLSLFENLWECICDSYKSFY